MRSLNAFGISQLVGDIRNIFLGNAMKLEELRKKLAAAEGRSEFVIAVVCDIRGFSEFSTQHESPDTAMFIKRFYLKLLSEYFDKATFAKPTGDGLLMTFSYTEKSLTGVSAYVLEACFKAITDFPHMFKDDPMINFPTPTNLGFGIARGPACCLFSGKDVIDYSGHVLNLAARLNDFARPLGVVIDGQYLKQVIPEKIVGQFKSERAYIRSIAEQTEREIFVSSSVCLPSYSKYPIAVDKWTSEKREMTVKDLQKLTGSNLVLNLKTEAVAPDKVKVEFGWPHKAIEGYVSSQEYACSYYTDAKGAHIKLSLENARKIIGEKKLTSATKVFFELQYVSKTELKGSASN